MKEPIFLQGVCKEYLWGGNRLREEFGKKSDSEIIAESWELACHIDGSSIILNGKANGLSLSEYILMYGSSFLGTKCDGFNSVPVLIKLIDAKDNLSVQVHPDDEFAFRVEGEPGKTEMWYIVDAEPGSFIYYGINRQISKEDLIDRIQTQTLTNVLNRVEVRKGDLYFIPSGTIHAVGAGILIAEIQQNSNTTYRVYDYGRKDKDGKTRCLHIDKALEVVNLNPMKPTVQYEPVSFNGYSVRKLEHCKYFSSDLIEITSSATFTVGEESFQHLLVLSGCATILVNGIEYLINKGDSIMLPANLGEYSVCGVCSYIKTYY